MKTTFAIFAFLFSAAAAFAQDPVIGMWKTEVDDGAYAHVDVKPCDGKICGTIARTFDANGEYQSKNLGKNIIQGMVPDGAGKYSGQVWRPSNGKIYVGKLVLSGDSLKMKGCIAGGLICSSQNWTRIP